MERFELRPLGIGEILDRAVTVFVKNLGLLATLSAISVVPLAIVQFLGAGNQQALLTALQTAVSDPAHPPDAKTLSDILAAHPASPGSFVGVVLAGILLGSLVRVVLAGAIARRYRGEPAPAGEILTAAIPRWPAAIGLVILFSVSVGIVAVAVALGVGIVTVGLAALTSVVRVIGVILLVVWIFAAIALVFGLVELLVLVYELSIYALVVEGQGAFASLKTSFGRVFARPMFRRSLVMMLVLIGLQIGVLFIISAVQLTVLGIFKSVLASSVTGAAIALATTPLIAAVVGVYYFDVRVRRDGLDLALAAAPANVPSAG